MAIPQLSLVDFTNKTKYPDFDPNEEQARAQFSGPLQDIAAFINTYLVPLTDYAEFNFNGAQSAANAVATTLSMTVVRSTAWASMTSGYDIQLLSSGVYELTAQILAPPFESGEVFFYAAQNGSIMRIDYTSGAAPAMDKRLHLIFPATAGDLIRLVISQTSGATQIFNGNNNAMYSFVQLRKLG